MPPRAATSAALAEPPAPACHYTDIDDSDVDALFARQLTGLGPRMFYFYNRWVDKTYSSFIYAAAHYENMVPYPFFDDDQPIFSPFAPHKKVEGYCQLKGLVKTAVADLSRLSHFSSVQAHQLALRKNFLGRGKTKAQALASYQAGNNTASHLCVCPFHSGRNINPKQVTGEPLERNKHRAFCHAMLGCFAEEELQLGGYAELVAEQADLLSQPSQPTEPVVEPPEQPIPAFGEHQPSQLSQGDELSQMRQHQKACCKFMHCDPNSEETLCRHWAPDTPEGVQAFIDAMRSKVTRASLDALPPGNSFVQEFNEWWALVEAAETRVVELVWIYQNPSQADDF